MNNSKLIGKAEERYSAAEKAKAVKTGIAVLDSAIGGMMPGELILLGARPGTGKSALAARIARHVGKEQNRRAVFFKMEEGGVFSFNENVAVCFELKLSRVYMKHVLENAQPHFVVLDILQRMPGYPKTKSCRNRRSAGVEKLLAEIKQTAQEFQVPVLITTQIMRSTSLDMKPLPEVFPFSRSLLPCVDTCLLAYHKDIRVDEPPNDDWNNTYIDIIKTARGEPGTVAFRFI